MEHKLRIGVIGTGNHTRENILPSLRSVQGIELYAIQSRDDGRAHELADEFNISTVKVTNDIATLIRDPKCDAVVVAATPTVHESLLLEAIKTGKSIFVEKPPASSLASFEEIRRVLTAASSKTVTQFGFNFRYSDFYRSIESLTQDANTSITYMKIKSYSSKPVEPMWQYSDIFSSSLYAIHIHAIEMLCYTLGEVTAIKHDISWTGQNKYVAVATIAFANGKLGVLELSNMSNRFEFGVECIDTNGNVIRCEDFNHLEVFGPDFGGQHLGTKSYTSYDAPFLRGGFDRTGYSKQFEFFRDSIIQNTLDNRSMDSCFNAYKVMEGITKNE